MLTGREIHQSRFTCHSTKIREEIVFSNFCLLQPNARVEIKQAKSSIRNAPSREFFEETKTHPSKISLDFSSNSQLYSNHQQPNRLWNQSSKFAIIPKKQRPKNSNGREWGKLAVLSLGSIGLSTLQFQRVICDPEHFFPIGAPPQKFCGVEDDQGPISPEFPMRQSESRPGLEWVC